MSIKVIYEKFLSGDALTDLELKRGYEHFDSLSHSLNQSGPVFTLARNEATRVAIAFEGFINARKRK